MAHGRTHYETLGVDPTASDDEIRSAYRRLARTLHPDRHQQSDPAEAAAAAGRMRDVNAAWTVLSDRAARRSYDRGLAAGRDPAAAARTVSTRPGPTRVAGPGDEPPRYNEAVAGHSVIRGVLWLLLVGLLGAIFVFTAYATSGGDATDSPDRRQAPTTTGAAPVRRGSCVELRASWVEVVPCAGPHDAEVLDVVPIGRPCPDGSPAVYLPDQQESVCLKSASPAVPR
jgi:DnaJ-domain-containing protein 1